MCIILKAHLVYILYFIKRKSFILDYLGLTRIVTLTPKDWLNHWSANMPIGYHCLWHVHQSVSVFGKTQLNTNRASII